MRRRNLAAANPASAVRLAAAAFVGLTSIAIVAGPATAGHFTLSFGTMVNAVLRDARAAHAHSQFSLPRVALETVVFNGQHTGGVGGGGASPGRV